MSNNSTNIQRPKEVSPQEMVTQNEEKFKEFNQEEIERLRSLLDSLNKTLGSCSLAQAGYSPTQKGYKWYDPSSRRILISLDVTFNEVESFLKSSRSHPQGESVLGEDEHSGSISFLEELGGLKSAKPSSLNSPSNPIELESTMPNLQLQPSSQPANPKIVPNPGVTTKSQEQNLVQPPSKQLKPYSKRVQPALVQQQIHESDLSSVHDALRDRNWACAMIEEMNALDKNETWDIVTRPKERRIVGCKWVFTVKFKVDGTLERYKARLVAKGYTQTYGVDYQEAFAPVAKMNTVRILLSLVAYFDWGLQQFDVKNAFLHGELEEEVNMEPTLGFERNFGLDKVCKLKKALYGLK
ncbi:hypothetical protein SLEP1_g1306 [Rubroshorea leprosula]|uniref:Reverse transcriptase Ty1/copia-type domain-containing protein n=1 Tax=Rubroshorea leprosula TaxID=152421 RepID=A0AAV5HI14_9ROSI|nr:hypothetical protein SLEP1_g1306 [Rubroshorea leprosula]